MNLIPTRIASLRNHPRRLAIIAGLALASLALVVVTVVVATRPQPLPDMTIYEDAKARKAAFFAYLGPIVEQRNLEIRRERDDLLDISNRMAAGKSPSVFERLKLQALAERYRVDWDEERLPQIVEQLERRVDTLPVPLVLVQAAKESGWGTSRFAREANNLFGQWCFRAGCGIVPARRAAGAKHEVRDFDSVDDSVAAYLHNINTGKVYRRLREIRQDLREAGKKLDGSLLADGLLFYSQRREDYVNEVKRMLHLYHKARARRDA